jgi:pimeloyl-ACP methyl ester carboxylesterase
MKKYTFAFVATLMLCLISPRLTFAATAVIEDIGVPTVWTPAESPYVVSSPINVTAPLAVLPGTFIDFEGGYLLVHGKFMAKGTADAPVSLKGSPLDSSGIYFYQGSDPELSNIQADGLGGGLLFDSVNAVLSHSWMENGGYTLSTQNAILKIDTTVATSSLYDLLTSVGSTITISSSTFSGSQYGSGILLQQSSHLTMTGSRIIGNAGGGIILSGGSAEAISNWWGDPSGPFNEDSNPDGKGNAVSRNVSFVPWLDKDPNEAAVLPSCCSNVLFLPGLEASRLYTKGVFFENKLWEPNWYRDVEKLYLDQDGQSILSNIYTRDIIDEAFGINIYKKFGLYMDSLVASKAINTWEAFPYDWRFDPANNPSLALLVKKVESMASSSQTHKVTLVTHSNGGLIGKWLMSELEKRGEGSLVDKLILVAVPQVGTAEALPALLYGYDQRLLGGLALTKGVAKKLAVNMSSAYDLLPSAKYFDALSIPLIETNSSETSVTTIDGLEHFLSGTTANMKLLARAKELHQILDEWKAPSSLKVIQIAGEGIETVKGIKLQKGGFDPWPTFTWDGDGTVVSPSASFMDADTYYLNLPKYNRQLFGLRRNRSHKDILEVEDLQKLIGNLIQGKETLLDTITQVKAVPDGNRLGIGMQSLMSLDLYDSSGNHTGERISTSSDLTFIDEQIPNSSYRNLGEGQYVTLDDKDRYELIGMGGGIGVFSLTLEETHNDAVIASSSFIDIPVTPLTTISLAVDSQMTGSSTLPVLAIDADGDGKTDFKVQPKDQFDPILYLQSMRKVVATFGLKAKVQDELFMKIDHLVTLIQKGKIKNVEMTMKRYTKMLKKEKGHYQQIDSDDKAVIINLLDTLLDNLH